MKPITPDFAEVEPQVFLRDDDEMADGGPPPGPAPSPLAQSFYSYSNLKTQENETCGQAALATLLDYFGLNPFNLPRLRGQDGRPHFENETFVGALVRRYPPAKILSFRCTTPEQIENALLECGLHCERSAPDAYSDGQESRAELTDWIRKHRLPVLTLLDMPKLWPEHYKAYTLHWGVIYSVGASGVAMASWHQNWAIEWPRFMASWHCGGLWAGLNYLQFRVWR